MKKGNADLEAQLDSRRQYGKINTGLEHFLRTKQAIPEDIQLNILSQYAEGNGRFLPHRLLPEAIQIQKITRACQIILRKTKGQHEASTTGFYDTKRKRFVSGRFVSGKKNSVSADMAIKGRPEIIPLFTIHNHPDKREFTDQVSFFSHQDFKTFLRYPYLQFIVMVTSNRIYLVVKTSKTAAAFSEKNIQAEIDLAKEWRMQEIKNQTKRKGQKLSSGELLDIQLNFNLKVCATLHLGFYSSEKLGRITGNRKIVLSKKN